MTGTLWHLGLAALLFVALHFLSRARIRASIVDVAGENAWLGTFSMLSVLLLAWLIWAYGAAPEMILWTAAGWARWLPIIVMPVATVLVVCGYITPNPTIAGIGASVMRSDNPARGIIRVTRHPLMWGVVLWALSHIPANGDAASVILFGSMAALALLGMPSMDAKLKARKGDDWARLEATTSLIPFVAIAQGRTSVTLAEIGWWRIGVAAVFFFAFLFLHHWALGVSPLPVM